MHVYDLEVTIRATEELFADTFVEIALTEYIEEAKGHGQPDAMVIEDWKVEEISHRQQEDE